MLRVDVSSRSSYLKDFILNNCFLRRWWTVIDFYCLFIHRSGLRLKFQDHCEFVDSVHNWLLWLERTFIACWYFEGSCWDLGRLCVGIQFIRLFKRLENSPCVYLKFGFAPLRGLSLVKVIQGCSLLLPLLYWNVGPLLWFTGSCPCSSILYFCFFLI